MGALEKMQRPEQVRRLVQQGCFLLKTFHQEYEKDNNSRETAFWRGELAGFRHTLDSAFEGDFPHMILEDVRRQTGLGFPHVDLKNQGMDREADF
jgi:hypothetical protein